jgi:GNAT superfamily N-acetyltransferase
MYNPEKIEVRSATRGDAKAISHLVAGFRDFLKRSEPSIEDIRASVNIWLRCQTTEVSIAHRNGEAVGYATTIFQYSLWANGIGATVSDLFVQEGLRRSGAGRRLIEHTLEVATRRGARSIGLNTNEMNIASNRIYESLGFSSHSELWQGRQVAYRKSIAAN